MFSLNMTIQFVESFDNIICKEDLRKMNKPLFCLIAIQIMNHCLLDIENTIITSERKMYYKIKI